jgi:hypothetical protein
MVRLSRFRARAGASAGTVSNSIIATDPASMPAAAVREP